MSFRQDWDVTKKEYAADKTLPTDVTIEDAEETLTQVTDYLLYRKVVPFKFDLPQIEET
jgi:hypothetical protein